MPEEQLIDFGDHASIETVAQLKQALETAFEQAKAGSLMICDLSRIGRGDSACAQLLLAASKQADANGLQYRLRHEDDSALLQDMLNCDSIG